MGGGAYAWSNTSVKEKVGISRGLYAGGGGAYRRRNTLDPQVKYSKRL